MESEFMACERIKKESPWCLYLKMVNKAEMGGEQI
jgi:hypothetical protein